MKKLARRKVREIGEIFDIKLSSTSINRVLRFVRDRVGQAARMGSFFIVTPNPEIVNLALKEKNYAKVLNSAQISLPDGIGLVQATRFLGLANPENKLTRLPVLMAQGLIIGLSTIVNRNWLYQDLRPIRGRDVFLKLAKLANKKGWRVFLLGGEVNEAQETVEILKRSLKRIKFMSDKGPLLTADAVPRTSNDKKFEKRAIEAINEFKPHLLFVAFKFPAQEIWVHQHLSELEVGGVMVVGGTFNYISGRAKFPPVWMENFGLEWLWRLFTQPWRIGRVLTAFPLFPLKVFWYKLTL